MEAPPGYMLKHKRTLLERAEKFISSEYFTDVNLHGRLYEDRQPVDSLQHFAADGRISYEKALLGEFKDTSVGSAFGPTWSTHWFKVQVTIPEKWVGREVRLRWDSNSEAMLWRDGKPIQGFNHDHHRTDAVLCKKATKGDLNHTVYMEMACNGLFGAGANILISPPDLNRKYTLSTAEVAVMDPQVYALLMDFQVLIGMVKHLPDESNRGYQALFLMNEMINTIDFSRRTTLESAHDMATRFFSVKNGASQHTLHAVGHCHIDTAWLWPYEETERKCGRSWSTTIRLMEQYPDLTFACSQAQQFAWVKERYPQLYEEIRQYVKAGRFLPVGGAWVELDGNIPSGESFMRQFLYGQQFYEKEFGIRCSEFWLPDTFGYSAQLPQICHLSGIKYFLTQKMSWSLVNKFPHHTFKWEGLDGTRMLAHFPPGDSYNMQGEPEDVLRTLNNFRDKGRSNHSMYLFGDGDGGQGPNADMIERLQRMCDIDGLPKVQFSTPAEFFHEVETHESTNLCRWQGELYLELHNGTYTTQAKTKQQNRRCEFLLRDAEILSSLALTANEAWRYPSESLARIWKLVLLNQFHDVLPGSSIGKVYKDVMVHYKDVRKTGKKIISDALGSLVNSKNCEEVTEVVMNTLSWPRKQVVVMTTGQQTCSPSSKRTRNDDVLQVDMDGLTLALVDCPGMGIGAQLPVSEADMPARVQIEKQKDGNFYIWNEHVEVVLDALGRVSSCFIPGSAKNLIKPGEFGNQLVMFDDVPLYWDAWDVMDYHLQTRRAVVDALQYAIIRDSGPLRVTLEVSLKISDKSYVKQLISLDAGSRYLKFDTEVTWHESHQFLKVEFATDILARQATYDTQCGHLQRPTTFNTSWDWARFEVCGHKWADISQYEHGLAVLNDSKYGWSCIDNVLRLSLLRSPKAPDEKADMGIQKFVYAMMPHRGSFQNSGVIQAAYELNCPLRVKSVPGVSVNPVSFLEVDTKQVIVEALKQAEDKPQVLVMRLYEAFGGEVKAKVKLNFSVRSVQCCNVLEDVLDDEVTLEKSVISLSFKPFQIRSILLHL